MKNKNLIWIGLITLWSALILTTLMLGRQDSTVTRGELIIGCVLWLDVYLRLLDRHNINEN